MTTNPHVKQIDEYLSSFVATTNMKDLDSEYLKQFEKEILKKNLMNLRTKIMKADDDFALKTNRDLVHIKTGVVDSMRHGFDFGKHKTTKHSHYNNNNSMSKKEKKENQPHHEHRRRAGLALDQALAIFFAKPELFTKKQDLQFASAKKFECLRAVFLSRDFFAMLRKAREQINSRDLRLVAVNAHVWSVKFLLNGYVDLIFQIGEDCTNLEIWDTKYSEMDMDYDCNASPPFQDLMLHRNDQSSMQLILYGWLILNFHTEDFPQGFKISNYGVLYFNTAVNEEDVNFFHIDKKRFTRSLKRYIKERETFVNWKITKDVDIDVDYYVQKVDSQFEDETDPENSNSKKRKAKE